jgi:hypothetical protein
MPRKDFMMPTRSRRKVRPDDLVANPNEISDFILACGCLPAVKQSPNAALVTPKPIRVRNQSKVTTPRKIRNLAEARWLAQMAAEDAWARRAKKSNVDKTPSRIAEPDWWGRLS